MNKNLKNITKFYLYSVIALSSIETMCSERNSSTAKNLQEIIPLFNFRSMNTENKYNDIVLTLPQEENTKVNIQCDKCAVIADGLIPDAYKIIFAHRKLHFVRLQPKKNSKIPDSNLLPNNNISEDSNEKKSLPAINNPETKKRKITDSLNPETNPSKKSDKIQKIETNYSIKYEGEHAIIKYSDIDTPEKYNTIAYILGSKSIPTIITCSHPPCKRTSSGASYLARYNMRNHTKRMHGITPSTNELRKKFDPDSQNETNYIELPFSSITTQKQYDDWAFEQPKRKTTLVILKCPFCPSQRKGKVSTIRTHTLDHIEKKHLICRCGRQYESSTQIEECKAHH